MLARTRSWIVGSTVDQARFRAVSDRLVLCGRLGVLVGVPHLVTGWFTGPFLYLLVALAVGTLVVAERLQTRVRDPEVVTAVVFVLLLLNTAASAWASGGAGSPVLVLLAVTVFTQAVALRIPVMLVNTAAAVGVAVVVALTAPELRPDQVAPSWVSVLSFTVLVVMLGTVAVALVGAETTARAEATVDALTGLRLRRGLEDLWDDMRARDVAAGRSTAVLMVDVDHFKQVNDEHGHERGDAVLVATADRLLAAVRAEDVVVRFGGEEFAVLVPGGDEATALAVAERLRADVSGHPAAGVAVTVSIGVGTTDVPGAALREVLRGADVALYAAKRAGRDTVRLDRTVPGTAQAAADF